MSSFLKKIEKESQDVNMKEANSDSDYGSEEAKDQVAPETKQAAPVVPKIAGGPPMPPGLLPVGGDGQKHVAMKGTFSNYDQMMMQPPKAPV